MEVVAATPNGTGIPPYHNHDVHEWSTIDSLTGVLERARLETDHWAANTSNSSHKYGKVVDCRARSGADGAVQQRARKQVEVFQSIVPGGHLQVVKSHSVSTSRWTNKTSRFNQTDDPEQHFGDLELSLNPLDLTSQKSKATVGRSVGRRPPSRPRSRDDESSFINRPTIPYRVSRLCHQVHENSTKQTFGKYHNKHHTIQHHQRDRGDGVEVTDEKPITTNGHIGLARTKSSSSEDLHLPCEKDKSTKSIDDLEDLEQLQSWRRTSKIRRSLQFPKQNKTTKPIGDPAGNVGSVRKIREDLETGRRLSTALRGNNVDLEALDQILQSLSSSSSSEKNSTSEPFEQTESKPISARKEKRSSFVTVESLQEVRGRLRRTSSPGQDVIYTREKREEETDDGIVTEESKQFEEMPVSESPTKNSRVRSYVYGMEAMMNKKPMLGTGSLESRSSRQFNGTTGCRNEDWYNRRKSYGFEQVHNQQEPMNSISKNNSLIESSTDSGICRSSEIVLTTPTLNKINKTSVQLNKSSDYNSEIDSEKEDKHVFNNKNSVILNVGNVKRYTSIFENKIDSPTSTRKNHQSWNHQDDKTPTKDFEGTTITIPIMSRSFPRNHDDDIKRHSIAVDESKYVTRTPEDKFRRTSLAIYNDQDALEDPQNRKHKKVEFCKTEVHFAAESGRVNIVATDEKPPPTNNFRRRRRNPAALYNQLLADANKNGLPVLHFGDSSYEKTLFGIVDPGHKQLNDPYYDADADGVSVTVSTNQLNQNYDQDDQKDEGETPKGILKNKPIKPKPYLLGGDNFFKQENEQSGIWGVKLKPVQNKSEIPMWRSTVTLKNTLYERQEEKKYSSLENGLRVRHEIEEGIRIVPAQVDPKRASWCVADKLGQVEDPQRLEHKGYSTKVNIGGGEATVIEDYGQEAKADDNMKDGSRRIINKGLVVRIGRDERKSHRICSNTVTDKDSTSTTTTKITIDLSPSPANDSSHKQPIFQSVKLPRATLHNFKSTSLILNTFKSETANIDAKSDVPQQLEALRRLYEDWQSDSEADKEVQSLMHKNTEEIANDKDVVDTSSVLSGSWSKMRAFKNVRHSTFSETLPEINLKSRARLEKDLSDQKHPHQINTNTKKSHESPIKTWEKQPFRTAYSPVILRKTYNNDANKKALKTAQDTDKLSSPFLVGKNVRPDYEHGRRELTNSLRRKKDGKSSSPSRQTYREKRSPSPIKQSSPVRPNQTKHIAPIRSQRDKRTPSPITTKEENALEVESHKSPSRSVLRNLRKSELAYFGIKTSLSPKPVRKALENGEEKVWNNKPDLLQHYDTKESVRYRKETQRQSHFYENIDDVKKSRPKPKFDSSILDELTKAADEILQAVNGYGDDLEKLSEDDTAQTREKLDTISETKSWHQESSSKAKPYHRKNELPSKPKLKHTSSTSSVESVADHRKSVTPVRKVSSTENDTQRKKANGEQASTRAATKARRLQRASSREALLQSHGSSSEDLPVSVEVPVRKPRLVRKTKATQLTVTSFMELKVPNAARRREEKGKSEERMAVGALPEIRHKTAVSTIRSTAEKTASRARRLRNEELAKNAANKKDTARTSSLLKSSKIRSISTNKEAINHRTSTANIKKYNKSEGSAR